MTAYLKFFDKRRVVTGFLVVEFHSDWTGSCDLNSCAPLLFIFQNVGNSYWRETANLFV